MNTDSLFWGNWCRSIKNLFIGSRISQIKQINRHRIELSLITNKGIHYWHICLMPPHMWLDRVKARGNSESPGAFCMVLRKHLEGCNITDISQINGDKIICVRASRIGVEGKISVKKLFIELIGGSSNIVLTENEYVIDAFFRNEERQILPHEKYTLSETSQRLDWLSFNEKELLELFKSLSPNESLRKNIFGIFNGFSSPMLHELSVVCNIDYNELTEKFSIDQLFCIVQQLLAWKSELESSSSAYCYRNKNKLFASALFLAHSDFDEYSFYSNANELMATEILSLPKQTALLQKLKKKTEQMIAHENRKLKKITSELQETKNVDKYKLYADLLAIYAYLPHEYKTVLVVPNLLSETGEEITIPLVSEYSIAQNSQYYYRKYNRLKKRAENAKPFVKKANDRLEYLKSLRYFLETDLSDVEIDEINKEIFSKTSFDKKQKLSLSEPEIKIVEIDGYRIGIGKNNTQNEYLTMRMAKPNDLWLHIKDQPGSHVVIFRDDSRIFTDEIVLKAAAAAAYYSNARDSGKVEVDYTLRKYVKKPKNGPPGFVYYTNQKTVNVVPEQI